MLTVWGSRQEALTNADAPLAAATREGHRLALYVVILAVVTAGLVFALAYAGVTSASPAVREPPAGALVAVLVLGLAAVFVRYGSPPTLAREAWHQIHASRPDDRQPRSGSSTSPRTAASARPGGDRRL